MNKTKLVVVGNGMVGHRLCEKLAAKSDAFDIVVIGEEPRPAYDRIRLSEYFGHRDAEKLGLASRDWYARSGIELRLGDPAVSLDTGTKTVGLKSGTTLRYDRLVLATGSAPFVPPVAGTDKQGVFVYRTIEDLEAILEYANRSNTGAVMGGGLLGLEAAKALLDMGLETHVIEFAPRLMPRQIDADGGEILREKLEALNVRIHTGMQTEEIEGDGSVRRIRFADGSALAADMLVISAGIRPRDELARAGGLATGPRGGIVVDDSMRTSHPDVFAVGECALYENMIYGLAAPGYEMAEVVADRLTGGTKTFAAFDLSTKLKLIGVDVASFGDPFCEGTPHRPIAYTDRNKGVYKRINVSADGSRLLGGILVGDAAEYNILLQTCRNGVVLPPDPEEMLFGPRNGSAGGAGIAALPDSALICSCESVDKRSICAVISENELSDVTAVKRLTKAGTGCGGCAPMLADLLNETLNQLGVYRKKALCEHFDYSRQQLFDLIRYHRIASFRELLGRFGRGHGCEICKPAAASVFASIWNENVQDARHVTLQDTNDRFLANIQRGGTYSVVPRVPGGEITPDKLIVLGGVAKKYGLYCKITGGQRIDLFGAQLNDLPSIWEELIAAGFESGHAYAKALRTVKSCVGTTWCRYGVQDSVGFAIRVEERYKGLRAPHKIKSAVSGCIRECAEAQSKDFGIIATEKGWNLYVCGNGGSKPQHAQLLASDLDDETCIRYIDRFLMFYIRTADPLTRTAAWFNKLEGGIGYLRDVVIHDALGICTELERDMQRFVDTYRCEWREAVRNPDIRRRFKHFVNSDDRDGTLAFREERGQKVPAGWGSTAEAEVIYTV
jgi:nitrite reductase (NADH) large subunit